MRKGRVTLVIFSLLILNDILDTIAQLFMKKGLTETEILHVTFSNIMELMARGSASFLIWAGVVIYVFNFFIWIVILYKIDLSVAMPVGSTCYIFVPLAAVFFLHEKVSPLRWLGVVFIILGIHFVLQSKRSAAGDS